MNQRFAPALGYATVIAAIAGAAAMTSSKVYAAGDITIDPTPFVSMRSRDDVRAEVLANRETLTAAANEWTLQHNQVPTLDGSYTRAQARAAYQASRDEVAALTREDSGSSYFARQAMRMPQGTTVAATAR